MKKRLIRLPILKKSIRDEFPILSKQLSGMPIIYLDSASTSLKPRSVLEAIQNYYENTTANVHRATHPFGEKVTELYESARDRIAQFLNASPAEVVFVRNTTEAINLVATGLRLDPEDEILITPLEHHSNQLPWLSKTKVKYLPLDSDGLPRLDELEKSIGTRTRLLATSLLSNVTGIRAKTEVWSQIASKKGIPFLIDAAQAAGHMPLDVSVLGCDFLAFSGHKVCGPSGIGVLWGKSAHLEKMVPTVFGGGMVHESHLSRFTLKEPPLCFEAGTPNIEGALGLAAAIEFLQSIGMSKIEQHSLRMGEALSCALLDQKKVKLIAGRCQNRYGIASFYLDVPGLSAEALGRMLADSHGIMVSTGMHCTHPYHNMLGYSSTVRASTHVYTTDNEIEIFSNALDTILQ